METIVSSSNNGVELLALSLLVFVRCILKDLYVDGAINRKRMSRGISMLLVPASRTKFTYMIIN